MGFPKARPVLMANIPTWSRYIVIGQKPENNFSDAETLIRPWISPWLDMSGRTIFRKLQGGMPELMVLWPFYSCLLPPLFLARESEYSKPPSLVRPLLFLLRLWAVSSNKIYYTLTFYANLNFCPLWNLHFNTSVIVISYWFSLSNLYNICILVYLLSFCVDILLLYLVSCM